MKTTCTESLIISDFENPKKLDNIENCSGDIVSTENFQANRSAVWTKCKKHSENILATPKLI